MIRTAALALTLAASLLACGGVQADCPTEAVAPAVVDEVIDTPTAVEARRVADANINSVLWIQTSAEFVALSTQAYRGAMASLDAGLADTSWTATPVEQQDGYETLPPAIILDLDETVLDNSGYQAWLVASDSTFGSDTWTEWCEAREATAVPGALAFLDYARERGVTVFFLSNRPAETEAATRDNLAALGVTLADDFDDVLLKREQEDWGSAKGTRRAIVTANYRVVLSIGDNLGDFVDEYKTTPEERAATLADNADRWGREWIVLPNPTYGSWEQTLYAFDYALSPQDQRAAKLQHLRSWDR